MWFKKYNGLAGIRITPSAQPLHAGLWYYPQEQTGQNCEDLLANLLSLGVKAA